MIHAEIPIYTTRHKKNNLMEFNPSNQLQSRTNDHVFDFPVSYNDQVQNTGQYNLVLNDSRNYTVHTNNLFHASERFAQQLDVDAIQEQTRFMDNGFNATAEITSLFLQSTKLAEEHNFDSTINLYLTFTKNSNLVARDVVNSFIHSIISSVKLESMISICEAMGYETPEEQEIYIDRRGGNVYGDYPEWQKILHIISFDEDQVNEYLFGVDSDFGRKVPTIKFVIDQLEYIGTGPIRISDILKLYLLTNIKNVSSLVAIKALLSETMPPEFNSTETANGITAAIADTRFTQVQFSHDLAWLMKNLIISTEFQEKCIFFMDTKESMLKWSQKENTKQHLASGRVRLRYRAGLNHGDGVCVGTTTPMEANNTAELGADHDGPLYAQKTQNTNSLVHVSQMQEDSLVGWALRARVPPAISHKSKLLGYVLMAQRSFADPSEAIQEHFMNDKEIASNMLANLVCKPQASTIIEFLHLLTVHVTPFDELVAFRTECFTDFSYTDSKDLSWTKFLQLYIAAYQNEDIWPLIWRNFCNVLSHQVLIAVGNFKNKYIYAVKHVARICMQDEESSRTSVKEIY